MTTEGRIWAVVPVKDFASAKQRLSPVFSPAFRRRLAATMVEDVLAALAGARTLAGIVVVTDDPDAAALARRYGAHVRNDAASAGHTGAVAAAARALVAEARGGMLSMPGDVPGATPGEIDALVAGHPAGRGFSIVPALDERGSNAIVASPPDVLPLAFGDDSHLRHLTMARTLGLAPLVRRLPGIGLDVDNPKDLFALAAKAWTTRTHRFLASSEEFAAVQTSAGVVARKDHPL